jgi:hypothetical protein
MELVPRIDFGLHIIVGDSDGCFLMKWYSSCAIAKRRAQYSVMRVAKTICTSCGRRMSCAAAPSRSSSTISIPIA